MGNPKPDRHLRTCDFCGHETQPMMLRHTAENKDICAGCAVVELTRAHGYIEELEQQGESLMLSLANNELQIAELRQRLSLREELAADPEMVAGMKRGLAYLRDYDKIVSELREPLWYAIEYIEELEQQLSYQSDRAESFCTRLHEEEHRNEELRQRCETMSAYLRTHDHRLHDAAMAAAKEH